MLSICSIADLEGSCRAATTLGISKLPEEERPDFHDGKFWLPLILRAVAKTIPSKRMTVDLGASAKNL